MNMIPVCIVGLSAMIGSMFNEGFSNQRQPDKRRMIPVAGSDIEAYEFKEAPEPRELTDTERFGLRGILESIGIPLREGWTRGRKLLIRGGVIFSK
jgi:hypothetical protein